MAKKMKPHRYRSRKARMKVNVKLLIEFVRALRLLLEVVQAFLDFFS